FVSNASIVPQLPRVLVGLARHHHTWRLIEASHALALHLIGEEHLDWVWRFGLQSGEVVDKLEGISFRPGATGAPLLAGVLGWLDCRVEARRDTGDRPVYLAEVVAAQLARATSPLTVKRLLQVAPADRLQELQRQTTADSALDAAAIHAWRQRHGITSV